MCRCLNLLLLLLFCLVYHSETAGTTPVSVTGKKGENTTLSCQFQASDILRIELWRQKSIFSCQNKTCENRRFKKKEACDVIFKNLSFSDAGKYTLKVFYNNIQTVVNQKEERMYQLHIHGKISMQKSEELDDLSSAHQIMYQPSGSTEWREVWNNVQSDVNHHNFKANDTGIYRVLDFEGNTLITATVTDDSSESKDKRDDTDKDKTKGTEQFPVWAWILIGLAVLVVLAVLAVLVVRATRNRDDGVRQGRINAHAQGNGPDGGPCEIPLLPQRDFNRGVPP